MTPSSDIAFSPSVKAVQQRRGSRAGYAKMEGKGGFATTIDRIACGVHRQAALILSRDGERRRPALYSASWRAAGLPAGARREDARLRRFQRQPAIHLHRQSRRQCEGHAVPHGLREPHAREDLGHGARGRGRSRTHRQALPRGLQGPRRAGRSSSPSRPGTATARSISRRCSSPRTLPRWSSASNGASASSKPRMLVCAPTQSASPVTSSF